MSATSSQYDTITRISAVSGGNEDRVGTVVSAAVAVGVVVAAVFYLVLALQWHAQPFLGALVTHSLTIDGSRSVGQENWAAVNAGLRRGDHLTGINDTTFAADPDAAVSQYQTLLQSLAHGATVRVAFDRPVAAGEAPIYGMETCGAVENGIARCELIIGLTTFPDVDFLAFFIVPFLSGVITLAIGIVVLVLRPRALTAQVVTGICLAMGVFMVGIFDIDTSLRLTPLWIIGTTFGGALLVMLALIFPSKLPFVYRRPGIEFMPLAAGALIAAAILLVYANPATPQDAILGAWLAPLVAITGLVVLVITLLRRRATAVMRVVRDQANTVLIGVVLALSVAILWVANIALRVVIGFEPLPLNTSAAMPFLILPPLSMAYAVLQYRSLDTDRVISQAITYAVMLFALLIGYFLLVFSAALIAREAIGPTNPILLALLVFLVAVLFVPVRTRLQARIDAIYFRRRTNYQAQVEEFGQRLSSLIDFNEIISAYRTEINNTLLPTQLFIFLPDRQSGGYTAEGTDVRFAPDSPLIERLEQGDGLIYLQPGVPWESAAVAERARLLILKTTVLVALRGTNHLIGLVSIAPPRSTMEAQGGRGAQGGRYTVEELRFVQTLTTQISVAVERAQVVESLEGRVRELDVLSQVSQAVNFTVEMDDLLELIYAQTNRLIDASHFYITLLDPQTDELYHAFFLEDGERYPEKENQRWALGGDLFSEVARSRQPLVVTNYAQTIAERVSTGEAAGGADVHLRGWLGVPMQAGARTIGVLAAGTTDPDRVYRDDQRKIFMDIGALAATSLDKARLFAETNARARQLAALNNITRQIVATELDLEKLLQLITASVTDILSAEAGSLLLTVEDGSGDLEFRVAVGGSGEELIGSRLPSGMGLVGEVAATGVPVIVNDAANDPRWGGELGKGTFHTNSVLAVPLVTQDRVIGVLEVLNKRFMGSFSRDDADLLTAFAGQAAVAIENARLFQMTDLQLSERLTELETLEQIDVELNRSLDLTRVAEISLHWAMENTGATAGLLGIVAGEPAHLEVIYKVGYDDDELPQDAGKNLLSLDRGIVSRVMRTRHADLVPDVSIDRDYVPSKRGALSQITLPMLSGGEVNAIMVLETDREPRLRLAAMPFLQRLAEHASIAIANAQLYAELTRANASKSEFVSFVAHELKNPLTSIQGYSDILLKGAVGGLTEQQQNFLGTIRFNAERMNTLVSDLNDVTKLQTNNLRIDLSTVNFRKALVETLRPFQQQIDDKGQTLDMDVPEDLPPIHADQNRLIQVLTNLVSNAHKYTPPDGVIRIRAVVNAAPRDSKGRQIVPLLHVSVADTGIGMNADDLNRLFTPYFRSDNPLTREQPGTGLGLTITRGIIQAHGGDIWVESELGVGTTFHFTIPLVAETEAGD